MGDATLVLSGPDLRRAVSMKDTIAAVREAFVATARGEARQPTRIALDGGREVAMLARIGGAGEAGAAAKLLSIHGENRAAGRPTIQGLVIWFAPDGRPAAVLEGTTVTAMRTGAASGVATELLAPPDASTLGIVGAGAQAWDQVMAVAAVRRLRRVRVASAGPDSRRALAARLAPALPGCAVEAVDTVLDAVRDADVVVTATPATSPLFALDDLSPTCHVNAIGSYRPSMRELPVELLRDATVLCVDQLEAAQEEAGELIAAVADGALGWERVTEIGALLSAPPAARSGRTVFKSVGIAAQDWALVRLAVERAGADAPSVRLEAGEPG
jgi:ornithine cyclodeaminase